MSKQPINLNWMKIPKDIRKKLLNNVWCTNCIDVVRIVEYFIEDDKLIIFRYYKEHLLR